MSRRMTDLRQACWIGGLVLVGLIAGPAAVYAHSEGTCANNGISSCNKQHPNNYDARLACANSVLTACASHKHSASTGAAGSFTSAPKPKPPQILRFRK